MTSLDAFSDREVTFTGGADVRRVEAVGQYKVRLILNKPIGLQRAEAMTEASIATSSLEGQPWLSVPYVFEKNPDSLVVGRAMGESLDPSEFRDFHKDLHYLELDYLMKLDMPLFYKRVIIRQYCRWMGKLHDRNKYAVVDPKISGLRFSGTTGLDFSVVDPPQFKIENGVSEDTSRKYDSIPEVLDKFKRHFFNMFLNPMGNNEVRGQLDRLWDKLLAKSRLPDGTVDYKKIGDLVDPLGKEHSGTEIGDIFGVVEEKLKTELAEYTKSCELGDEQILKVHNRIRLVGGPIKEVEELKVHLSQFIDQNPGYQQVRKISVRDGDRQYDYILVKAKGYRGYFGLNGARSVEITETEKGAKKVISERDRNEMAAVARRSLLGWFNVRSGN